MSEGFIICSAKQACELMKNIDENSFVVKQEEKMNEELTIDNFIDDFKL